MIRATPTASALGCHTPHPTAAQIPLGAPGETLAPQQIPQDAVLSFPGEGTDVYAQFLRAPRGRDVAGGLQPAAVPECGSVLSICPCPSLAAISTARPMVLRARSQAPVNVVGGNLAECTQDVLDTGVVGMVTPVGTPWQEVAWLHQPVGTLELQSRT